MFVPLARSTPFGLVLPKTTKAPTNNISNNLTNGGCLRNWSIFSSMLGQAADNGGQATIPQTRDTAAKPQKARGQKSSVRIIAPLA